MITVARRFNHLLFAVNSTRINTIVTEAVAAVTKRSETSPFSATIQSINQSCIFRVVQVTKSLQDLLEVGNNLPGISDVRERGLEQKCF